MSPALKGGLQTALTLAAALAGGVLFALVHLPVPWLAGAMVVVASLAMAGAPVRMHPLLRDLGFLVAGVSLGSTVTPEALQTIARYPFSLLGLVASIFVTVGASRYILERFFGWDMPTAFLASVPGVLSMVMAMAAESSGDVRRIAIVQAVRLFALVTVMPLAINATTVAAPLPVHSIVTPGNMALMFLATFIVSDIFGRMGTANPLFLGGMVTSTLLHVSNVIPGDLPTPLTVAGMVLVGMFAGMRFHGTSMRMLLGVLKPALIVLAVAMTVSAVIAVIVHLTTGLKLAEVLVAFAPGGVEAMILMGASMGLDTLYISTHHVLRSIALNAVTPFFAPRQQD